MKKLKLINHIRERMKEQDLTIQELAFKCRIHTTSLSSIIRGKTIPRLDTALTIAKNLHCNPFYLWEEEK